MDVNAATALATLGWRTNTPARLTQAIRDFQGAWNLGTALAIDGSAGPLTRAALQTSLDRRAKKQSDISANFNAREFACACGGSNAACRRIWVTRTTVRAAESLRNIVGPFTPHRACRCPVENRRVGGASQSQHLYGAALDLGTATGVYGITVAQVRALGVASGIGHYTTGGRQIVRHIDTRHASPVKTAGTVAAPALWAYGAWGNRTVLTPRPIAPPAPPPPPAPKPDPKPDPKPPANPYAGLTDRALLERIAKKIGA